MQTIGHNHEKHKVLTVNGRIDLCLDPDLQPIFARLAGLDTERTGGQATTTAGDMARTSNKPSSFRFRTIHTVDGQVGQMLVVATMC
jgi:hypothetical protein